MSILGIFEFEDLFTFFYLPILLAMQPTFLRDTIQETPTRAACRWTIRELLFVHVFVTLTPQLFLTGILIFSHYFGFKYSVVSMLLAGLGVFLRERSPKRGGDFLHPNGVQQRSRG